MEITYNLEYRENGEVKTAPIKIDWVSNYCTREFQEIITMATDVKKAAERLGVIMKDKGMCLLDGKNKKDGWKEDMRKLDAEEKELTAKIEGYNDNDYFKKRFNLLVTILKDNKCPYDFMFDFDFWDRQVDPTLMMEFLAKAVYKDIQGDKKGGKPKKSTTLA